MEAVQLELTPNQPPKSTHAMVQHLRNSGQDYEWYPTTNEILEIIKTDIESLAEDRVIGENPSILDCGAGDGRSLMYLTKGDKYAIEKATSLVSAMDNSIFVIGADFHQQVMLDKSQEVIFSNPPYAEYEEWARKIIREANSAVAYLVIPQRWKNNKDILNAIELREADADVLGSFDFLTADRKARAKVDVVRIAFRSLKEFSYHDDPKVDPFDLWFEENFKIPKASPKPKHEQSESKSQKIQNELVKGGDLIQTLTELYDRDMAHLMANYKAFESLDHEIMRELGVSYGGVRAGLKEKVAGLKNVYWLKIQQNSPQVSE